MLKCHNLSLSKWLKEDNIFLEEQERTRFLEKASYKQTIQP